jgi:hypothetical protein
MNHHDQDHGGQGPSVETLDSQEESLMDDTMHPQTRIRWGDWEADVDEGLAPLLLEIWKRGLRTQMSCQENEPGVAWIAFASLMEAQLFLDLVALRLCDEDKQTVNDRTHVAKVSIWRLLYSRMVGCGDDRWKYSVYVHNWGDSPTRRPQVQFMMSVRFPVSDIPLIMEQLQGHPVFASG